MLHVKVHFDDLGLSGLNSQSIYSHTVNKSSGEGSVCQFRLIVQK